MSEISLTAEFNWTRRCLFWVVYACAYKKERSLYASNWRYIVRCLVTERGAHPHLIHANAFCSFAHLFQICTSVLAKPMESMMILLSYSPRKNPTFTRQIYPQNGSLILFTVFWSFKIQTNEMSTLLIYARILRPHNPCS